MEGATLLSYQNDRVFTDVVIRLREKEKSLSNENDDIVYAHKFVLQSRCPLLLKVVHMMNIKAQLESSVKEENAYFTAHPGSRTVQSLECELGGVANCS